MSQTDEFLSTDTSEGSINVKSGIKIQSRSQLIGLMDLSVSVFSAPHLGVQETTNFPELGLC